MSQSLDRARVLGALDDRPQTVDRLARELGEDPERVEATLASAHEAGLVVDWGHVWATTWRAKLSLSPRFFRVWVPASLAIGAFLTATALILNGPAEGGAQAGAWLIVGALAATAIALVPRLRENGR